MNNLKNVAIIILLYFGLFFVNYNVVYAECYEMCSDGYCEYITEEQKPKCILMQNDNDRTKSYIVESAGFNVNPGDSTPGVKMIEVSMEVCAEHDDNLTFKSVPYSKCKSDLNYYYDDLVSCGDGLLTDIPRLLPRIIHLIYLVIQILVPILLALFGSIDFVKAVIAQKDDDIKRGQQTFVKRLIYGLIVFFIFMFVSFFVSAVGDDNKSRILNCVSCIINNDDNCKGAFK